MWKLIYVSISSWSNHVPSVIGHVGKVLFREKKINIGHLSHYFLHSVEVVTSVVIALRLLLSDANKTII